MAFNLELKIKVDSHPQIINKLKKINSKFLGILKQKDIYYKVSKGLLKLRVENKNYWLIKYFRDEKGKRWSNYEILKLSGRNPEKYLSEVFSVDQVVQKERKLFLYKNTRIHLDKVKGLGNFLELESVVTINKRRSEKEFNDVVRLLNLDLSKQIRASYKRLLEQNDTK
ncbi:MAG: class IV adenylate cyclase [Melioribacteraceae bacterium]|nr:class IV adenylate cyclase [Melioribacteraceae bacterium]